MCRRSRTSPATWRSSSPSIYFDRALDKTSDRELVSCRIIPARGAWLEFEMDRRDTMGVRIDRKRRQSASVLLRALEAFKFNNKTGEVDIDRKLRPGEPPTAESAAGLLQGMYFNPKRYDLAKVGRYKINAKLDSNLSDKFTTITKEDLYNA